MILKNTLDYVIILATATRHRHIFALKMIDEVISNIHALRSNINTHKLLLIQWDPLKKHQEEQKLKDLEPTSQQKAHKSITKDRY